MNSPFTDFESGQDSFTIPEFESLAGSPFDNQYLANSMADEDHYVVQEESELSAEALTAAVNYNRKSMEEYGWVNHSIAILKAIGITDKSWITNDREENLVSFTKFFANWQESKGYKNLPGQLGLNNWTYFQTKIGLNKLSNAFNIDVKKAISANKVYSRNWGRSFIFKYLNNGFHLNDEYFAYLIAKFQNEINPSFNKKLVVDGILGNDTWEILRTLIEKADPGFDIKQHLKQGDTKGAAEKYVEARDINALLMTNVLEKIQKDVEGIVRNEPIEFNTTRETIYALVNGIVGAVPIVGAAGNAMLDFNKAYYDNINANIDRTFDRTRSLTLNDIIYFLKNQTAERPTVIVIQHLLEDRMKFSGNLQDKVFKEFTNEIERLASLNQNENENERMKIAISNLISALSPQTRIYIHCRNTSDFKDWGKDDILNILNDANRKRLNISFTNVHPNISWKDSNLPEATLKNLRILWQIVHNRNFSIRDLRIKKDVFFRINLPLRASIVINSYPYNVEFTCYLKTISANGEWSTVSAVPDLPPNQYRLPGGRLVYKDKFNDISRALTDKNNKGISYQDMFLEIANAVMQNEYGLPAAARNAGLLTNEFETDSSETKEFYLPTDHENVFSNEEQSILNLNYQSVSVNLKATKFNQSQLLKSGLQLSDIITCLSKSVDFALIRQKLLSANQASSTGQYQIDSSGNSVDSVFTEAVHQFQINNYLNPSDQDGVIGQSSLETLGIFNHKLKSKTNSSGYYGQAQLNRSDVKSQVAALTNNEFAPANWFHSILKPAWLGIKISDGIHLLLLRKLKEAEQWLLSQAKYKGLTPAGLGKALGFNSGTSYSGARLSASKQAMHGFGLALDINVSGNPWIGAGWVQNDERLLKERSRMITALKKASGNGSLPGSTVFEYLHSIAQASGNDTSVAYQTLKQRNDEFVSYLKTNSTELSYWNASQSFGNRNPLNGFLNLHPDLVYALRQIAGLAWGAIDFGPRASGDIMHFDMRTTGVGKFLCEKIGGYVSKSGHPAISVNLNSNETDFENDDHHEFNEEFELHEAVEEAWENNNEDFEYESNLENVL